MGALIVTLSLFLKLCPVIIGQIAELMVYLKVVASVSHGYILHLFSDMFTCFSDFSFRVSTYSWQRWNYSTSITTKTYYVKTLSHRNNCVILNQYHTCHIFQCNINKFYLSEPSITCHYCSDNFLICNITDFIQKRI